MTLTADGVTLRRARLQELSGEERLRLVRRPALIDPERRAQVRAIVEGVRDGGDAALRDFNARFGGGLRPRDGEPAALRVPKADTVAAAEALAPDLRQALLKMIATISTFHEVQVPAPATWVETAPGVRVGRLWRPIERVGAYIPGGEAAYPSSLIMCAVPAMLARVGTLVIASPANVDGEVSATLLGTAGLLGIDELYVMGGAQAVAALAYGTGSMFRVDKIVGPGNSWVTGAKLEVLGTVGIDLPAGPSEVMILADASADPRHIAADLLSQAEHGPDSPAMLVTTSADLADAVEREIARQLPGLPRRSHLLASLESAGLLLEAPNLDAALSFVNEYAPEHLTLAVREPSRMVERISNAGSVFLGPWSPESAGDYATGTNHVLPTGGLARSSGALSVESFGKWLQVQELSRDGLAGLRDTVGVVAEAEGLTAHRRAVEIRFEDPDEETQRDS